MTTLKQIEIANYLTSTKLVTLVFHSCILHRDAERQTRYPVYKKGNDLIYAGIDDAKGLFAYIRETGDISADQIKIESCSKSYKTMTGLRVVFFHDRENRDFAILTQKLAGFTFLQNVTLNKIITDKYRLITEESPLFREKFDGKTFYVAFDIMVSELLNRNDCEIDDCPTYINPIKCLAAAPMSIESAS